ncbi:hypothetical protein HUJ05_010113 [Dendroctonus ponderosae]|nr:hypothetical protein HUJ05_010113 [Dendroctonus ponderosae]
MNLNEPIRNAGRPGAAAFERRKLPLMGPPKQRAPKSKSDFSSSKFSELPWGKSHESLVLNSSSNKKSTSSRSTTDMEEDKVIVALTEGRGEARCEVGIAAVNVSRPVLILCQTSDSQSYNNTLTKLNIFNPHLIIYPATFDTGKENRLIAKIRKHFSSRQLMTIPRKAFSKANGLERLYKICIQISFPLLIMIKNRYYALAAASGLLTYLQDNMFIYYASNSIKLEYQTSEGYAIIDIATADRLELVCSNQPAQANRYSSLLGIMNRCLTRIGTRNLRSIILQPLYSSEKINERLDCVEELIRNPGILLSVQGVLPKLASIDQLLSIGTLVADDPQSCNNRQLNYLLLLNSVVETIQPLKETLKNAIRPFFSELSELLNHQDFDVIKNMLRETIHESAYFTKGQQAEQQRIWAIKPGLNGLLDLVRKTYSERIEDMREYIKRLGQKYDLPLALANNNKKGFHITMALNQNQRKRMKSSDLPPEFIQVFRLANSFTMKTAELVNLTTRIDDILTDLFSLSNIMIHDITVKVKKYAGLFYQLVEGISYLDVLQSLAQASYANGWIRPKFGEYTNVVEGHHPLLNFLCQKTPIPNPVTACDHYNMHIITGPNGAGKSIFIRQVMLLQIMAQAGCFVPAESAIFRTADKMFARISNDDDMESSASSFVLEMNEVDYILSTMTDRSLIIIDELCRSTSLEEGISIAMSICEFLAQSQAFTFVTTHFTLLTKLADLYFNIKVWQLQTIPSGDTNNPKSIKLDFKFKLAQNATTLRDYGIYMVRGIWPQELMEMVDNLQRRLKKKSQDPKFPSIDRRARLRYDLNCRIQKLKLQNKFSISNLNKLINEYNENRQKLDTDVTPYSPNMMEILQQSEKENPVEMNHSIFDGSHIQETSANQRFFLENMSKGIGIANESDIYPEEAINYSLQNIGTIMCTPLASHPNSQNCGTAAQVKTRIEQIFTPNTKLDVSENASNTNNLELGAIVSYSQSSLDLTQDALIYETNENAATKKNDTNIFNCNRNSANILQEPQQSFLGSTPTSQLSSGDLSQQLHRIRQNEGNGSTAFIPHCFSNN